MALLIGFLFLLNPVQAFYLNADYTLDTGNLSVISHGIFTSNVSVPDCFSKTYTSGEIHFNNTQCLNYENATFFFEVLNDTWNGYKHLTGGDKEIFVYITYWLTDASNLDPLNLPRIGLYWVQDTTLKGLVAEYQLTGSDIATGTWHTKGLSGVIPAEATGYYASFNWDWQGIPPYATIKFSAYDTRTYDLVDTGVDITDTYYRDKCNTTVSPIFTPFAVTREGKLVKMRYTGPVYAGRFCGVVLLDKSLVTRLMVYEDRVCTSAPCHQYYVARDWAVQISYAGTVGYYTNILLLDRLDRLKVRGTAMDTYPLADPNRRDCENRTGFSSVDIDLIEGQLGGSVNLGSICYEIDDYFRKEVDIGSYFLTGDNYRLASYSGIGSIFREASSWEPFFDSISCKQRQTFCSGNILRSITSSCFLLNETSCLEWGCRPDGLACNPFTVGCFCTAPMELTCYNTTGHIVEQHVCTWGCNETTRACNPNPETGEPETFCTVDADCEPCIVGNNTLFTQPKCIGGTCHYSVSTYCEYGVLPAPACSCAPKPYTEQGQEWVTALTGLPAPVVFLLFAMVISLAVGGGITYYVNKASQGGMGGTGLGVIFGIAFLGMLFVFVNAGWVDVLLYVLLIVIAGLMISYQIVKAVGG